MCHFISVWQEIFKANHQVNLTPTSGTVSVMAVRLPGIFTRHGEFRVRSKWTVIEASGNKSDAKTVGFPFGPPLPFCLSLHTSFARFMTAKTETIPSSQ
jgi:hypothetical protein